jgi:hypothetical protein
MIARALRPTLVVGVLLSVLNLYVFAGATPSIAPDSIFSPSSFLTPSGRLLIHSETVVSGVDLRRDTLKQVLKKLGKPSHIEMSSPRMEWGRTVVTGIYEWQTGKCWVRATTLSERGLDPKITSLDVWGSHPDGEIGTTGRGLKLGDAIRDVRRIYGLRLYFGVTLSEEDSCGLDFSPESLLTLSVDFDAEGRVNHLAFAPTSSCISF